MKLFIIAMCSLIQAFAAENAHGTVWLDVFGGPAGPVVYPQYSWGMKVPGGSLGGFGFIEVAPQEPLFTNHLVVYTPSTAKWFSVHGEIGGLPDKGLGFVQVGSRVNIHEVFPKLKKPLDHVFVAALPRFVGIRPNNLLVSASTNHFKVTSKLDISAEGYRRFFGGGRPDYSEYWFLAHPKQTKHLSGGILLIDDGGRMTPTLGIRISQ